MGLDEAGPAALPLAIVGNVVLPRARGVAVHANAKLLASIYGPAGF